MKGTVLVTRYKKIVTSNALSVGEVFFCFTRLEESLSLVASLYALREE